MKDYRSLRSNYPTFEYKSFSIEPSGDDLLFRFHFVVPPDISFSPEVRFQAVPPAWNRVPADTLRNVAFHLGLIESFSYWKAAASPLIRINAGALSEEQIEWWTDLLLHGMGEFFYHNDIDFTPADFVRITARRPSEPPILTEELSDRSLVMIGGGRDSAFTVNALQRAGEPFNCMMLNPGIAASEVASGVGAAQPVVVRRSIEPKLLELNKQGFLNGHTPFSAYLAFLNAACLLIYGYGRIIVANERSSDEENVVYRNTKINHQYSKSFRFETRFDQYLQRYLVHSARYFSFVRPWYEIQIARAFATFPEVFPVFRSCNRNQAQNSWCGRCPKCLSVFITMDPFISVSQMETIFGADLYAATESIPIIRQLGGMETTKPFECVGTTDEIVAGLSMSVEKRRRDANVLPVALQYAEDNILSRRPEVRAKSAAILSAYGPHRLPHRFEAILKSYDVR